MAGKTIEESQTAQQNAKKRKDKSEKPKESKDPKQKISLSFKDANGHTFITHVDANTITAMNTAAAMPSTAHANLATIDINSSHINILTNFTNLKTIEYKGWLMCIDEPVVSIDWKKYSNNVEVSPAEERGLCYGKESTSTCRSRMNLKPTNTHTKPNTNPKTQITCP